MCIKFRSWTLTTILSSMSRRQWSRIRTSLRSESSRTTFLDPPTYQVISVLLVMVKDALLN